MAARNLLLVIASITGTCGLLPCFGGVHELHTAELTLALDDAGRLVQLKNIHTGRNYIGAEARPPWRMFYRSKDALELEIEPDQQKGVVLDAGNQLLIEY